MGPANGATLAGCLRTLRPLWPRPVEWSMPPSA